MLGRLSEPILCILGMSVMSSDCLCVKPLSPAALADPLDSKRQFTHSLLMVLRAGEEVARVKPSEREPDRLAESSS